MSDTPCEMKLVDKIKGLDLDKREKEIVDLLVSKKMFMAIFGQLSLQNPNMTGDQITQILNYHGFTKS